ncbi:MAG: hypothetical protein WBZ01_12785 [Terriglobales bacterium]
MKLSLFCRLLAFMLVFVWCVAAGAAPKEKEHEGQKIDAGSFGVFQGGHRVGTETFSIYQTGNGSVIDSEFKTENAPTQAVQTSEMQLTTKGEIRRYEWNEVSPGTARSVVVPNDDFLNQKWSAGPEDKEHEQPYLLSLSTSILDDYFFVHRELLAWKILGMVCKQDKGLQCLPKQHTQFPTLDPHQHSSALVTGDFIGREKVTLKSGPQDLLKLELKNDAGTWQLWLDDQFKVMKMSVVGDNTEVIRD